MKDAHQVALWAGVAAFFGSLLTIGVVDILNPDQCVQYVGALVVAAITAGGVYSKERLQDAKRERGTVSGPR
jgi:lysozyme family protein